MYCPSHPNQNLHGRGGGGGGGGSGAGTLYSNNFAGFSLEKWRSVQPLPCNVVDFMCLQNLVGTVQNYRVVTNAKLC